MSTFKTQLQEVGNGFIKNYWRYYKADQYNISRMTPTTVELYPIQCKGMHKRLGASKGVHCKQFDIAPFRAFKKFGGRTSLPHDFQMNKHMFHFRFGRKNGMHISNKFLYK